MESRLRGVPTTESKSFSFFGFGEGDWIISSLKSSCFLSDEKGERLRISLLWEWKVRPDTRSRTGGGGV